MSDYLFIQYMKSVQINEPRKVKRVSRYLDKHLLYFAFISLLFLLTKIGAEYLVERYCK